MGCVPIPQLRTFFFLPKNAANIPYRLAGIRADTISLYDPSHYIYNSRIHNTEIKQFLRPPKPCPAQGMVGLMFSIKKASQFGPILSSARSTARCRQGRGPHGALLTAMSHPCGCCVPGTGWSGSRTAELLAGVGGWKPQSASPHFPLHCSSCQFNSPPTKWHQCTANHNENICTDGLQINAPHLLSPALRAGITCMGTAVLQPEPCASPSPSSNPALGTGPAPHTPSNCDNRRAAQLAREGGGERQTGIHCTQRLLLMTQGQQQGHGAGPVAVHSVLCTSPRAPVYSSREMAMPMTTPTYVLSLASALDNSEKRLGNIFLTSAHCE